MATLTNEELQRYSRHLVLDHVGTEGQERLKAASVLVVGAGGLGCPALLYLAAAGVGRLGVMDADNLDVSNLQRQVLFTTADVGVNKAEAAARRLAALNPEIKVTPVPERLTAGNALQLIEAYDIVIDATDNFPTRYLVNDACVLLDKPFVYGSILEFEGQLAVFNCKTPGGHSSNYRDLFPQPPAPEAVPDCEQAGVIGALPGMVGTMQALEAIKLITKIGEALVDKLLIIDALYVDFTTIKIRNTGARTAIKELIDYENFCGINPDKSKSLGMKEITVQELQALRDSGEDFQLIDVREPHEYDICNLDGELIPMSEIPHNVDKIARDKRVVMHCRSGKRSGDMLLWLERNHGFENLYNLKGGILAWARDIDPDMPTY